MSTVAATIILALVMALFGARLILFIPLGVFAGIIERVARTEGGEYLAVNLFLQLGSLAVTLVVGLLIGLPWYAALIAGVFVGATSYARPSYA